ncbi:MAG: hypothetical protein AAGB22_06450, partial [Bacteroidota bacterium]
VQQLAVCIKKLIDAWLRRKGTQDGSKVGRCFRHAGTKITKTRAKSGEEHGLPSPQKACQSFVVSRIYLAAIFQEFI